MQIKALSSLLALALCSVAAKAQCPGTACKRSATPYCSSYLAIPRSTVTARTTSTVTSTVTSTSFTATRTVTSGTASRSTLIVTMQPTTTTTSKSIVTVQTDTTITARPTCEGPVTIMLAPPHKDKRQATSTKPACFSNYRSASAISSACRCLSIKPSTTTTTSTIRSTSVVTSIARLTSTKTIAPSPTTITTTTTGTKTSVITSRTTSTTTIYTFTQTIISGSVATPTRFVILGNGQAAPASDSGVDAPEVNGLYAGSDLTWSNPDYAAAKQFQLGSNGALQLVGGSGVYVAAGDADPEQLTLTGSGNSPLSCRIDVTEDNTCPLICSGGVSLACGANNAWYFGSGSNQELDDDGNVVCGEFDPIVLNPFSS